MLLILASCTKSPTSSNSSGNLISNPSFELNGSPSLSGWSINDTGWVKVVSNAPLGKGSLSMWLSPSVGPEAGGVATTAITGQSGRSVYTLSGWERNFAGWYWGYVSIEQVRSGGRIFTDNFDVSDSVWSMFSRADTLDILPGDSLLVTLRSVSLAYSPLMESTSAVDSVSSGVCFNGLSLTNSQH